MSMMEFRPDGKAGKLTVFEYLDLCAERDIYDVTYTLNILSESYDTNWYYNHTENGQRLLRSLYIEAMHTPYLKN